MKYSRNTDSIIFIVGVGRSGTSLLQSMLNAHSKIAFLPETHFFRYYIAPDKIRKKIIQSEPNYFINILENDKNFNRAKIPAEKIIPSNVAVIKPEEVFRNLMQEYKKNKGKEIVGDKDPRNIDFVKQLSIYFPQAHIVHLVRDPRDVILSRTKAAWSAFRPYWGHALIYNHQIRKGRNQGKLYFSDKYLEVKYEELIADPKKTLNYVLEHCGVQYEDSVLNFSDSGIELMDESERQWKNETTGPLLNYNTQKWRTGLKNSQIAFIQIACSGPMKIYGYEMEKLKGLYKIRFFYVYILKALFSLAYKLKLWFN